MRFSTAVVVAFIAYTNTQVFAAPVPADSQDVAAPVTTDPQGVAAPVTADTSAQTQEQHPQRPHHPGHGHHHGHHHGHGQHPGHGQHHGHHRHPEQQDKRKHNKHNKHRPSPQGEVTPNPDPSPSQNLSVQPQGEATPNTDPTGPSKRDLQEIEAREPRHGHGHSSVGRGQFSSGDGSTEKRDLQAIETRKLHLGERYRKFQSQLKRLRQSQGQGDKPSQDPSTQSQGVASPDTDPDTGPSKRDLQNIESRDLEIEELD